MSSKFKLGLQVFYQGPVSPLLLRQQQRGVSQKSGSRVIFYTAQGQHGVVKQPNDRPLQSPYHCGRKKTELCKLICVLRQSLGRTGLSVSQVHWLVGGLLRGHTILSPVSRH